MEKYDFSNHKFRASGFGDIMAGGKDLTEKQKETIITYQSKDKLTDKQQESLDDLINKRDNVELSKGAKTLLRKMRREVKFKRRREINSKYLTKGVELEETAIDWLSIHHDTMFTNNKERRNDEYFTGECDIVEGYDTKVSWSLDTLPDPEENLKTLYEFQNRVYMRLWDKKEWTTSSIALSMLEDEVNTESDEKTIDLFQDFVEIPGHERIVEKTVKYDKAIDDKMVKIAILAREYLQEIEDKAHKNT